MYQIKRVVNYDPEAAEQALEREIEQLSNDKHMTRLLLRGIVLPHLRMVVSVFGCLCSLVGLILVVFGELFLLGRILALLGLVICAVGVFFMGPAIAKALYQDASQMMEIMDAVGNSASAKYHIFVCSHETDKFEVWGAETGGSKFEVTLSLDVGDAVHKETFLCDFECQDPSGILVLDVGNEKVVRVPQS